MLTHSYFSPTVLVVDDDPDFLTLLLRMLRRQIPNCTLIGMTSPIEALNQLEQQPIALLITDQHMPTMNGTTLARHFKQHTPQTSILLLSGCSIPDPADQPIDAYLLKPFSQTQLFQLVQLMLSNARSSPESPTSV